MSMQKVEDALSKVIDNNGKILFLVGAGLSAESGIPTFRGEEGYWKAGSVNYTPQEIGTFDMFRKNPEEVWKWFLFRKTVCRNAEPNPGHYALKEIEEMLGDQFALVSQNVDGMHDRVGNTLDRLFLIHGNLNYARCGVACSRELYPFPEFEDKTRESDLSEEELNQLTCPKCGEWLRPHVLWFDEYYNEHFYKMESAVNASYECDLMFVIGTSGATNLPMQMVNNAMHVGNTVIDINPFENNFSTFIANYENGMTITEKSGKVLPLIAEFIKWKIK